jgi:DNA-binding NarL/FixJ family response regulator
VRAVHRGESRLSPTIARKVMEQFRSFAARAVLPAPAPPQATATTWPPNALDEALSDKEGRILDLLAQGLSNKQIAAAVFLAEGTVKNYVSRIMEKLHAGSRLELAVRAVSRRP